MQKIDTEYRKLKNQARFVMEIIDNKLVVSKKKKPVLVAELRKREYEPFPKGKDAKRAEETEDVVENEDEVTADEESGARDFDYLLGVSYYVVFWYYTANVDSYPSGLSHKNVLTSSSSR